jgi:uncharacterized damage-inducible protein DinB
VKSQKPSAAAFIADQLRRAFEGTAWHGPALVELLSDVDAEMASARPFSAVHSIWELLLHTAAWDGAVLRRIGGEKLQLKPEENFPKVRNPSEPAWRKANKTAQRTHESLIHAVAKMSESQLKQRVPGKRYDFEFMLHGVVQHELYHAGQIAILKKTLLRSKR